MPAPSSNTRRFGLQTLNPPCALWTNPPRGRGRAGSWGCLAGASGDMLCMAQRGACPRPRIQNFNVWRPPPWIYFTAFACAVHVADHASVLGIRVGPLRDAAAQRCSLLMGGGAGGERGGGILQHITFVCASKLVRNFRKRGASGAGRPGAGSGAGRGPSHAAAGSGTSASSSLEPR